MDSNPSYLETTEHKIIRNDDIMKNLVETKSFRCAFCKRRFSNAQALGGHMNIHRKDRAKLKEFSSENFLSLDITKNMDCDDSPHPDSSGSKKLGPENGQSPDDKAENLDEVEENSALRLPLFSEAPSVNDGSHEEAEGGRCDKHVEESRKVELINYVDLDLELRLGPEPHHAKSN